MSTGNVTSRSGDQQNVADLRSRQAYSFAACTITRYSNLNVYCMHQAIAFFVISAAKMTVPEGNAFGAGEARRSLLPTRLQPAYRRD